MYPLDALLAGMLMRQRTSGPRCLTAMGEAGHCLARLVAAVAVLAIAVALVDASTGGSAEPARIALAE